MGGCASTPKELDVPNRDAVPVEKSTESEVTENSVEGDASVQEGKAEAESATKTENKEEPLVDLSEPNPKAEKSEVVELAQEISEPTTDAPKEDAPVAVQVTEAGKKEDAAELKAEEVESKAKVSA